MPSLVSVDCSFSILSMAYRIFLVLFFFFPTDSTQRLGNTALWVDFAREYPFNAHVCFSMAQLLIRAALFVQQPQNMFPHCTEESQAYGDPEPQRYERVLITATVRLMAPTFNVHVAALEVNSYDHAWI